MPFPKLKLKKSKQQYNVASKSVFVITVELLDNSSLECTLSSESTGRDCMDNVCQRLGLQQPELFGLRYVSRRSYPKIRWVDLDRPLKKQLDKYAQEPTLYLGVMFYVNDVSLLEDEVTRYHYFLQLKLDVIEGRLRCNYEQAIVLASYSLQAEYGDHDPEKHTFEYLQEFALLPKPMVSQFDDRVGTLIDAIINQHASLRGIAQQLAEVYYIVGAQQLDGYGQECFLARDETGNEVLIGASLTGIVVRKGNGQSPVFFKWSDITNLVNHKRYFGIECQNFEYSVQFMFDEADSAKYVWKMCVLQHTFYKMHSSLIDQAATASGEKSNELNITLEHEIQHSEIQNFQQQTQQIVQQQPTRPPVAKFAARLPLGGGLSSNEILSHPVTEAHYHRVTSNLSLGNEMLSRSTNDIDIDPMNSTVPQYRPAPDYETAVRNKYGIFAQQILTNPQPQQPQQPQHPALYNSHPNLLSDAIHHSPGPSNQTNYFMVEQPQQQEYYLDPNPPGFPLQTNHTYSTPELNRVEAPPPATVAQEQIVAELQRLNLYKPPPPYPGGQLAKPSSNSTPDLASQTQGFGIVGGSSPDLVSRRNLTNAAKHNPVPDIHRTYDNLKTIGGDLSNSRTEQKHLVVHDIVPKNYVAYSQKVVGPLMPTPVMGINTMLQKHGQQATEPIYQNQQQIEAELKQQHKEPIYQNLPIHEKMIQQQVEAIDTTVQSGHTDPKPHVSRISITNSREDLRQSLQVKDDVDNRSTSMIMKSRSVTTINIGNDETAPLRDESPQRRRVSESAAVLQQQQQQQVQQPTSVEEEEEVEDVTPYSSPALQTASQHQKNNHHDKSKPRAARKRWGLNFGSKSGSLKSIKSEGGQSSRSFDNSLNSSGRSGVGPMMMATLQGLTRSRPDLFNSDLNSTASLSTKFTAPSKIPKDEIGAFLEQKLAEGEVLREFERIPKKKSSASTTACMAENIPRNRFTDVLPYEENRVKIATSDKDNKHGYINASHISATVGDQQRFYIAAQGPLINTVLHFWQMIFQCDVHLIVMLTDVSASTKTSSCMPYWPQKDGSTLECGNFRITKKFTAVSESYTTSTLLMHHTPSKSVRTVWHLQYPDWSDHGCPSDPAKYLAFLEEMSALRRHTATEIPVGRNRNPPVLVHCSAGVGRTGVTILSDILLYCVDHNIDIDIPKILTHLRQQRMLMVQTIAQYKFVHTVLIKYLNQSRLI